MTHLAVNKGFFVLWWLCLVGNSETQYGSLLEAHTLMLMPFLWFLFIAIQTGGKERTTEEWGFSPPTLSQPIWMLSQRQVSLSVESESKHCNLLENIPASVLFSYFKLEQISFRSAYWGSPFPPQWLMLKWQPVLKRQLWKPKSSLSPSSLTRYYIYSVHIFYKPKLPLSQTTNPNLRSLSLSLFLSFFLSFLPPPTQGKMDRTLALLQNADPADPAPDSLELIQLEGINLKAGVNLVALLCNVSYTIVF